MTRNVSARRKRQRIRLAIKKTTGVLAFVSFMATVGTAGAIECDTVPLLEGTVRMFGFLLLFAGFLFLAGAFQPVRKERRERREVHRDTVARPGRTGSQKPYSSW